MKPLPRFSFGVGDRFAHEAEAQLAALNISEAEDEDDDLEDDLEDESRAPSYTPTDAMVAEAERGLAWREEFGRGGTEIGVARARDIANRRSLSTETISRMVSYFARHEIDKKGTGWSPDQAGYPSAGRIAWALWGGDPGEEWVQGLQQVYLVRRAKELEQNLAALASLEGIRWHAIGPLQPKNAKYVARAAHTFHALERLDTAAELSKRLKNAGFRFVGPTTVYAAMQATGRVLVVAPGRDQNLDLSARNLPRVDVILADSLNVVDLLNADAVLIEQPALARMEEVYA